MRKAELMGISTDIFPVDTSDANASMDGRRKHKQPALTADFVNYYLGEDDALFFTQYFIWSLPCPFVKATKMPRVIHIYAMTV